jgi:hypothetical protein
LLLVALLAAAQASGQKTAKPFEPGEQLIYKAEVSRSLLKKVDVATFKFVVERQPANAHSRDRGETPTPFKFIGDVASEGFFTKLFNLKFHQHIESTVDPESFVVQKTVKLDEQGKRVRTSEATFDRETSKVMWIERDPNDPNRPERKVSASFTGVVQDVVSAIYYLRTKKLTVGESLEMEISDSGRVYKIPVRVIEKKRMKTVLGKGDVLRVSPELFGERGMVNTKGQFSIWLTDDDRHIPVKAQLKNDYGTFDITLKQISRSGSTPGAGV